MFGTMRIGVFGELGEPLLERVGKRRIDCDLSERSFPGARTHDGKRLANAGMVGTKHNAALRNIQSGKHCASNVSEIYVAGVRYDAANRRNCLFRGREVAAHISKQDAGIARIETPGNRGTSYGRFHGHLVRKALVSSHWAIVLSARNRAALFSNDKASARTVGLTPALSSAARNCLA